MNWRFVLLLAALAACGCKSSSVPGVDPFFGRTTVPPQPTGAIGRGADPAYATGPGGPALPPPSYGMPGTAPAPLGAVPATPLAPGGTNSFPSPPSPATSGGLPWTSPGATTPAPGSTIAPTRPTWPYSGAPTAVPAPAAIPAPASAPRSPYGTPYIPSGSGTTVPPITPSPGGYPTGASGAGAIPGTTTPAGSDYYRRTSATPGAGQNWTASAAGGPTSPIRIVEPSARPTDGGTVADAAAEGSAAADAAAIVADRQRIVRNLSPRPGSDTVAREAAPARSVNIADLPPADGQSPTLR